MYFFQEAQTNQNKLKYPRNNTKLCNLSLFVVIEIPKK